MKSNKMIMREYTEGYEYISCIGSTWGQPEIQPLPESLESLAAAKADLSL